MGRFQLPPQRVMNSDFVENGGRDDVVLIEALPIKDGELLKLVFESVNSPMRQGVWLKSDLPLVICEQECPSAVLWQDTSPPEVQIECHTRNGFLLFYNVWDRGQGSPNSQSWSSGMLVEEIANGSRYRCNDFGFETDFSKLVFRIERTSE